MHRFFVDKVYAPRLSLTGADAHYMANVLRMQVGEELEIVSTDQIVARMAITAIDSTAVWVEERERLVTAHEAKTELILLEGLPKGDKFDFVVQKAVELGVSTICPVAMTNCVVKLNGEKAAKKVERWRKIAQEAAQQARRDIIPCVTPVLSLTEALKAVETAELKVIAYEAENVQSLKEVLRRKPQAQKIAIIIGPEGGITKEEWAQACAKGFQSVSLGQRILRTETACVATLAAVLYEKGDFGG